MGWLILQKLGGAAFITLTLTSYATQPTGCVNFSSPREVVHCALVKHPDIRRAEAANLQAEELQGAAGQIPNPELGSKVVYGKNDADTILNTELSLMQPFELGGKRGARQTKASAEKRKTSAELLEKKQEVFVKTLLALYRLRQVRSEQRLIDEALSTFTKILKLYRGRPRLGPEQTVSLGVFSLADGDYKLRRASALTEEYKLTKSLEWATGAPFPGGPSLLPPPKDDWPVVDDKGKVDGGGLLQHAESELKVAEAERSLAESAAWPDLRLGPALETQKQGDSSFATYGAVLSIPLPLFNQNGGGKALAFRAQTSAQLGLELTRGELENYRDVLANRYQNSVQALKQSQASAEIEKKHTNIDELFNRGLIPSSLVIEAHRQILEFAKSRHEQELQAVEALWQIYALEGRMFEEKI